VAETFGLYLVQRGVVTREALYEALRLQRSSGGLLGSCLLELGVVRRGHLLQALAGHLKRPPAPPSRVIRPDPALAALYDAALLRRLRAVPYAYGRQCIHVAFADPRFLPALEALRGPQPDDGILLRLAVEPDVAAGLDSLYGPAPEEAGGARQPVHRPPRVISVTEDSGADLSSLGLGGTPAKTPGPKRPVAAPAGARPVPAPAHVGAPLRAQPAAAAPVPAPASAEAPKSPAPAGPAFENEDEVAFARATGFDKEQTAIFRLDDLAARDAKDEPPVAVAQPSAGEEGSDELLPPAGAPRLSQAVEQLFESPNEGVLARRLVAYFAAYFPRVLLLARHGETLRGILAKGLDLSGPQVVGIRVPAAPFARLFADGVGYYGPPPGGQELEPLYEALRSIGVNAFVLPIETRQEAPWMLYADHGDLLGRYGDVHDLELMAKEAATALDMLRGV
jgi:hypothetical protein